MDWRKEEKDYYLPKKCSIVNRPAAPYIKIKGAGDPNTSKMFEKHIQCIYKFSYSIKMSYKGDEPIENYSEYKVFPMEADWTFTEKGIQEWMKTKKVDKDEFLYTMMIRQPDFVTKEVFDEYVAKIIAKDTKNELPEIKDLYFEYEETAEACQCMHIGPYDQEHHTFNKMEEFIKLNNKERACGSHREIYVSDPRRVAPEKLKTTLSFLVK